MQQSGAYFEQYTRQDTGLVGTGGVSSHQIIAAAQFHNPCRCAAKTSLRKMSSVYVKGAGEGGLKLWGQIFGLWRSYCKRESGGHLVCNYC